MTYQRKRLSDMSDIGDPGPLPLVLQGQLADADLADLSWLPPEVTGYDGEGFFPVTPPSQPVVPATISASQLKRFLRTMARTDGQAGTLRNQVDALVAASGDGDLQDDWEYTTDYHRQHPRLLQLAQAVHLTSDQVDAAFIAASLLT